MLALVLSSYIRVKQDFSDRDDLYKKVLTFLYKIVKPSVYFRTHLNLTVLFVCFSLAAAISFDSLPSASSLEGLQAAHDKIKVAPKHRRPPRKARTRTSSGRAVKEPPHKMLHKRSNTVPEDLLGRSEDLLGSVGEADRHGSLVSRTIFESAEIGEDEVVSPTPSPVPRSETSSKDTAADSAIVRAQIEARATELVAKAKVSPKPRNRQKQGLAKPTGVVEETSKDVRETQGSSESLTTKEKDAKDLTTILKEPQEKGEKEKNSDHQKITDQAKKLVKRKEALKSPGDNQPASHVGGEKVNDFRGPHPKSSETVDTPLEETAVPTNESVTRAAPPTTEPVTKPADAADKPDWIALAQKKSKRVSQLLETADTQSEEVKSSKLAVQILSRSPNIVQTIFSKTDRGHPNFSHARFLGLH